MNQSWDQTREVYTVNLVKKKAVINIYDEPQIQRVLRKSLGTVQQIFNLTIED